MQLENNERRTLLTGFSFKRQSKLSPIPPSTHFPLVISKRFASLSIMTERVNNVPFERSIQLLSWVREEQESKLTANLVAVEES